MLKFSTRYGHTTAPRHRQGAEPGHLPRLGSPTCLLRRRYISQIKNGMMSSPGYQPKELRLVLEPRTLDEKFTNRIPLIDVPERLTAVAAHKSGHQPRSEGRSARAVQTPRRDAAPGRDQHSRRRPRHIQSRLSLLRRGEGQPLRRSEPFVGSCSAACRVAHLYLTANHCYVDAGPPHGKMEFRHPLTREPPGRS